MNYFDIVQCAECDKEVIFAHLYVSKQDLADIRFESGYVVIPQSLLLTVFLPVLLRFAKCKECKRAEGWEEQELISIAEISNYEARRWVHISHARKIVNYEGGQWVKRLFRHDTGPFLYRKIRK